ncbi:MAG: UvrD-helicase domain-containing protein [Spirochaetaceae bacterium]|jgi:DNA helicase-2/ATP-dependent DNA helicase PcrA|nr:UvrD-helicase domain-containing protein [Spirochaetaceae bacterium]
MSRLNIERELNPEQLLAATTIEGPLLIIAGAGSGKTRVITYRIAHMLERGIAQHAILALTFTNKAAREMEERVKALTGKKLRSLTLSTFHAFGAALLRKEIEALGWRNNFSIYDEGDKGQLIRECFRDCKINPEGIDIGVASQLFSQVKTGLREYADLEPYRGVYEEYERTKKIYNALDFDDLLTLPIALFEQFPEIHAKYHERFRYILIDEFQDTSAIQYRLMKMLAVGGGATGEVPAKVNICAVGDDDQSIYSWRGANYENIVNFEKDFAGVKEIKLEQNYRSTTTILEAANGVIAHNEARKEKKLWSGNGGGKPVFYYTPENETEEAEFIAERIRSLRLSENLRYDDFGVLVRTNSLTTSIEEVFLAENIPYRVSGGTSFFARQEIKDVLSYLRVIANPDDDVNLLRIVNTPRRGIGKTTIAHISEAAKKKRSSLWNALTGLRYVQNALFEMKDRDEVDGFMGLIEKQREELLGKKDLAAKVRALVDAIDYWPHLIAEHRKNDAVARFKFQNIERLIEGIETWARNPDNFDPTLYPYLNRISLLTRDESDDEGKSKVNLMTIHASKGLEFPVVFIAGAEDGIIPHERSVEEDLRNIEEERRLFYVAITRARDKLFITGARKRKRNKTLVDCAPSPFINEIPPDLLEFYTETEDDALSADDFFAKTKARFS